MDEEKLDEFESEKTFENQIIDDKGNHPIAPSQTVAVKTNRKRQTHITKEVAASKAVGFSEFVPIPKPPPPTLNSTLAQRTKLLKDMQAYMNQQACIAYGGPPAKAPPVIALHNVLGIGVDPSIQYLFARRGSDAQTQTSYEDTIFPIGFAALKKFKESFHDV